MIYLLWDFSCILLLVLPGVARLVRLFSILWDTVGEECTGNVRGQSSAVLLLVICDTLCQRVPEWFAVCSVNGFNRKTYFPCVYSPLSP